MSVRCKNRILALSVLVWMSLLASCKKVSDLADRQNCKQQLRSLWIAVRQYRELHQDQWPTNLESIDPDILDHLLVCPGVKNNSPQGTFLPGEDDYFYINWSQHPNVEALKYPVIYDQKLSNHKGTGFNVLMTDGSVQWYSDIEWLKQFSREHPDVKVPLPE